MLNTILCATDFSEHFRSTIDWGVWISRRFGARMMVFHAVPSTKDILYATDVSVTGRSIDEDIEQTRSRLESLMAGCGVDWEPLIGYGDSVESLTPVVASQGIDLVVAASYGLSGIKRMLLGTIVERMARSLNCPLWVVRGTRRGSTPPEEIRRILVACDFSTESRAVLTTAAAMAKTFGSQIRLVHAIEAPLDEAVVDPTTGPYEEVQQELQERLQKRLKNLFSSPSAPGVPVDTAILPGHPGEQIPLHARQWKADLIVVGVRRIGRVQKYLRGSTTEALLRKAPCSVLAVPAGDIPASDPSIPATEAGPERHGS
jgi:nucleotide-binding universal stress UspA family protein